MNDFINQYAAFYFWSGIAGTAVGMVFLGVSIRILNRAIFWNDRSRKILREASSVVADVSLRTGEPDELLKAIRQATAVHLAVAANLKRIRR